MKVAIVGASGFVGSALAESLWAENPDSVVPLIHSSGNAWQLARHGMNLVVTDVLKEQQLRSTLKGCTHVVNCFRAGGKTMIDGVATLLKASAAAGVEKFVHLSSVAVYGNRFAGQTIDESFKSRSGPKSYGDMKAKCDELVQKAARKGLPCVTLCPPNIAGINSPFLLNLLSSITSGKAALVDGGHLPCELIDVENLVHAIRLALTCKQVEAQRVFVTDQSSTLTWRQLLGDLAELADRSTPLPDVSTEEVEARLKAGQKQKLSYKRAVKRVFSSDVRKALSRDPMWDATLASIATVAKRFPQRLQHWLKSEQSAVAKPQRQTSQFALPILDQQLRNVRYSNQRASDVLGYKPVLTDSESIDRFSHWAQTQFGWNSSMGDLYLELHRRAGKKRDVVAAT